MKAHHSRNYSASYKKPSYFNNNSPTNAGSEKKDLRESFQVSDLKFNLNLGARTPSKDKDRKSGSTNVFINNFSVQIKPSGNNLKQSLVVPKSPSSLRQSSDKKHVILINRGDKPYEEPEAKIQQSGRSNKKSDIEHYKDNIPQTSYSRSKGTPTLNSKTVEKSRPDPPSTDFLKKIRQNIGDRKESKSPKHTSVALESSMKQQTHVKNKKSFDISTLYQAKKTYFADNYGKAPTTASNATNETELNLRSKLGGHNDGLTHSAYFGTAQQQQKAVTPSRIPGSTTAKLNNYLATKHKRAPSFDAKNDYHQRMEPSDFDKVRKSSDYGDLRLSSSHLRAESAKKLALRFAVRTRAGATHTGSRKTNQDSYIAHSNYGRNSNRYLFGICDGHGSNGHHVSGFVKETLPIYLLADPQIENRPEITFTNAYELCHQKLLLCDFDSKFSGTTCVTLLISGNRIISANAGDSRAVVGTYHNREWNAIPLSDDHKPNLLGEAQRILMAGGRIEAFRDQDGHYVGPSRVWLQNQDIPGLAMSRSIGDVVASSVGVTCRPEMKEFQITPNDKFIILASDGVWEFIESIDAVRMVAPFYEQNNLEGACDFLLNAALRTWQEEEENVVDDITLIIIFL